MQWSRKRTLATQQKITKYGVAILIAIIGLIVQYFLTNKFDSVYFIALFPAVFVSAWFLGVKEGLTVTVIGIFGVAYFLIEPERQFKTLDQLDMIRISTFSFVSIIIAWFVGKSRRIEKEFIKNNESFRLLVQATQDYSIFMMDENGVIQSWNSGAQKIKGFKAQEVKGKNFSILFPEEEIKKEAPQIELSSARRNGRFETEGWRLRKDGSRFWANVLITRIDDDHGKFLGFAEVIRDLTSRKRIEAELRDALNTSNQIRYALDASSIISFTNLEGTITYANEKFCELSKFSKEELLGQNPRILKSGHHTNEFFRKLWDTISRGDVWRGEIMNRAKDGSFYWVDAVIVPTMNKEGSPEQYIAILNDITLKKQQEEELRESETRWRQTTDSLPHMVWTTKANGEHLYFSRQWFEYTGLNLAESIGSGWLTIVHPDDQEKTDKAWKKSLEEGVPYNIEYRMKKYTGEYRWFLARAIPIKGTQGNVIQWFGTCTDIQNQKETQDILKVAIQSRDNFVSVASHELRTPLTSLKLQIQMAERTMKNSPDHTLPADKVEKIVSLTLKQVDRLSHLVDDMLDISRISRGKLALSLESLDFSLLVEDMLQQMSPILSSAECLVRSNLGPNLIIQADRFRMEQVLINLLTNAARYGRGAPIEVSTYGHNNRVYLVVKDYGIGIAKEDQERIFERFERAISASEISGLGLGLFIASKIAKAHNGSIHVESEVGKGASFIMDLPLS